MIGQVIGNYRIVSELGKGGMGMVYRAEHTQLGRPAALKMLLPQLSSDPGIVQRFFNEARAASAIDHPGIVEVYDFGTHTDGAAYIVMALLKGESLEHRLRRGPLPPLEGASIVAQVLGALAAAHARGIVHRDLKPDNIYLVPNELMPGGIQIKLLDFGIAKLADEKTAGFKTQTGMMMGTPAYMSPEQCMGKADLDHRTDLYSIGCILFHVLTGRPPFVSDQGTGMMIASHIRDPAPHPRGFNPHVPDNICAIVMRLLEKEPAARYQTALEVRDALVAAGAAGASRPPGPADQYAATMPPGATQLSAPPSTAATTASGSAAQVVASTQPMPPAKSNAGVLIGAGVLLATLGGVGVWAAMRGGERGPNPAGEVAHTGAPNALPATGSGADTPEPPAQPAPPTPPTPPTPPAQPAVVGTEPCPLGKVRGRDTHEHCCWPDQAWSSSKHRCVGAPRCPDGHKATGEECTVVIASPPHEAKPRSSGEKPAPATSPPAPPSSGPAPKFTLGATAYPPKGKILIKFASKVSSPTNNRTWVTVIDAGRPPAHYGNWTYVDDGATTATLDAPSAPGAYEVRVHTDYPQRSTNVRHTVPVTIKDDAKQSPGATPRNDQRFMLAGKVARSGEEIEITFPVAMKPATGERFWITVVDKDAVASAYGAYAYVPDGARAMSFKMPAKAGEYEIRLHANYPRLSTNLVHRARIRVED